MTIPKSISGRERLLETAAALFAASGFDGVTTKQLATQSGLSIGALYHHFPTKQAAYRAAVEWGLARIDPSGSFDADETATGFSQLKNQVVWFCRVVGARSVESRLLRLELLDPHLGMRLSDLTPFTASFERFTGLMAKYAPKADTEMVLAAIVSLSFGFSALNGLQLQVPGFAERMRDPTQVADVVMHLIFTEESEK